MTGPLLAVLGFPAGLTGPGAGFALAALDRAPGLPALFEQFPVALLDRGVDPRAGLVMLAILLAVAGRELRLFRLRVALNRALHELRRPLQVLALDSPDMSVHQAIRAAGRLDHTLNGGPRPAQVNEEIGCRWMVGSCVRRWISRANLAGAGIEFGWIGPDVRVRGDGATLCAAIENVILNAIEHGGPEITVRGTALGHWVRIEVTDSGVSNRPADRKGSPAEMIARQRTDRHGHGLGIVRDTVEGHGGKLEVSLTENGSTVAVVLPSLRSPESAGTVRVEW